MKSNKRLISLLVISALVLTNTPLYAAVGSWSTNGSNVYYNDGNVGIGTNAPSSKFQVSIPNTQDIVFGPKDNINSNFRFLNNTGGYNYIQSGISGSDTSSKLRFSRFGTSANLSEARISADKTIIDGRVNIGYNYTGGLLSLDVKGGRDLGPSPNVVAAFRANDVAGVIIGSQNGNTPYIGDDGGSGTSVGLSFFTNGQNRMRIKNDNGNVGIGTTNPTQKLSVNGAILAKEVIVSTASSNWPDYVFEDKYELKSLEFVKQYIEENKKLPNIPSADEVERSGIELGEMQKKQMEKIEELTLYVINLQEQINELKNQLRKQL